MFLQTSRALIALVLIGTSVWITTPVVRSVTLKSQYGLDLLTVTQVGALIATHPVTIDPIQDWEVRKVTVTAYSSSADETDETPNITAMGSETRNGVIAANFLPFGAKVRIPSLFGDTVFTVEDRMHKRFQDRIDVWFPTKAEAKRFGLQSTEVEIEI